MVSQLWLSGAGRVIVSASSMSTGSDMYRGLDPAKRYAEFSWNDLNPPEDSAAPLEWVSDTQTVDYQMGIVLASIVGNKQARLMSLMSSIVAMLYRCEAVDFWRISDLAIVLWC
jgi:hypothetical protein